MKLTPATRRFVLHWGSMGTQWGVNRTVAQIHALLYLSSEPLSAETITEELDVARSNVSTSLRELLSWRLIERVPVLGDRRDHFAAQRDVWEMFKIVLEERKRREFDPTLLMLRETVDEMGGSQELSRYSRARLEEMLEFFESTSAWYDELRRLPVSATRRLMKLGRKVRQLVDPQRAQKK